MTSDNRKRKHVQGERNLKTCSILASLIFFSILSPFIHLLISLLFSQSFSLSLYVSLSLLLFCFALFSFSHSQFPSPFFSFLLLLFFSSSFPTFSIITSFCPFILFCLLLFPYTHTIFLSPFSTLFLSHSSPLLTLRLTLCLTLFLCI